MSIPIYLHSDDAGIERGPTLPIFKPTESKPRFGFVLIKHRPSPVPLQCLTRFLARWEVVLWRDGFQKPMVICRAATLAEAARSAFRFVRSVTAECNR